MFIWICVKLAEDEVSFSRADTLTVTEDEVTLSHADTLAVFHNFLMAVGQMAE